MVEESIQEVEVSSTDGSTRDDVDFVPPSDSHVLGDEEDTESLDGFVESVVGEEEVPHSIPDTAVEVVAP